MWEHRLAPHELDFLSGHRVGTVALLPATHSIELARSLDGMLHGHVTASFTQLTFTRMVFLGGGVGSGDDVGSSSSGGGGGAPLSGEQVALEVRVAFELGGSGSMVFSSRRTGQPWDAHASMRSLSGSPSVVRHSDHAGLSSVSAVASDEDVQTALGQIPPWRTPPDADIQALATGGGIAHAVAGRRHHGGAAMYAAMGNGYRGKFRCLAEGWRREADETASRVTGVEHAGTGGACGSTSVDSISRAEFSGHAVDAPQLHACAWLDACLQTVAWGDEHRRRPFCVAAMGTCRVACATTRHRVLWCHAFAQKPLLSLQLRAQLWRI